MKLICDHAGDERCSKRCPQLEEHEKYEYPDMESIFYHCEGDHCKHLDTDVKCIPVKNNANLF